MAFERLINPDSGFPKPEALKVLRLRRCGFETPLGNPDSGVPG